jgi:acyl carrier protein
MMLLMGIEDAFHIELDESAIFEKVEDVYKYLQSHGAK